MENAKKLHFQHEEACSEIKFLKNELEFLLKILRNCYSTNINLEKIKLLDAYWKGFEHNISKLNTLSDQIHAEENGIAYLYKNELIDERTDILNRPLTEAVQLTKGEIRVLKDSFYAFMHDCNACALKTA